MATILDMYRKADELVNGIIEIKSGIMIMKTQVHCEYTCVTDEKIKKINEKLVECIESIDESKKIVKRLIKVICERNEKKNEEVGENVVEEILKEKKDDTMRKEKKRKEKEEKKEGIGRKRPRGRPPLGKVWDKEKCKYV